MVTERHRTSVCAIADGASGADLLPADENHEGPESDGRREQIFWCALGASLLASVRPAVIPTSVSDNPIIVIALAVAIYFVGSFVHIVFSGNRDRG